MIGAFEITPGEPAWMLSELNLPTPDSKATHRYQIIRVARNDRLVEWWHDMGDAALYRGNQFNLMGGYVDERGRGHVYHSVSELREMADELRNREKLPEIVEEQDEAFRQKDWKQLYEDEKDRRKRLARPLISNVR